MTSSRNHNHVNIFIIQGQMRVLRKEYNAKKRTGVVQYEEELANLR